MCENEEILDLFLKHISNPDITYILYRTLAVSEEVLNAGVDADKMKEI